MLAAIFSDAKRGRDRYVEAFNGIGAWNLDRLVRKLEQRFADACRFRADR